MTNLITIQSFLDRQQDVDIGQSGINFFRSQQIDESSYGESVRAVNGDSWRPGWLVIAIDANGNPIACDLESEQLEVKSIDHDSGDFETTTIADNLESFESILQQLYMLQSTRSTWQDCYSSPILPEQRDSILCAIAKSNSKSELWFWEHFLGRF